MTNQKTLQWDHCKGSGGQGIIIAEDGRTVAVAYDEADAPVLAASQDCLSIIRFIDTWFHEVGPTLNADSLVSEGLTLKRAVQNAIQKANGD